VATPETADRPKQTRPDPTPPEGPDPYGNPDPEWRRIDWREHLRTADVGGTSVNYVEMGSGPGPDLVLVHGLAGCWQNWLETIPHLTRNHRVLALDLPGFGASPMAPWELTIPNYGRLLLDFCEAVGVGECALVGHSMGGFVSAEAAIAEPDRFAKLVLISAAGISSTRLRREPTEVAGRLAVATSPLVLSLQERGLRRARLRIWAFQMVFHRPDLLRPELLWEFFHNGGGTPGFLPALVNLAGYDFHERLAEVELPSLIVWGRNDRIVPSPDALEYGRLLGNSSTVIFDKTGHVPQAERPVRFNRVLETFLSQ
jgi:pimeloyl-ACP methyl ester carboxylesterase